MKHYTSIEQSKKLLELGLSPKTADMGYNGIEDRDIRKIRYDSVANTMPNMNSIPCWSLGSLLSVMPFIEENKIIYKPLLTKSKFGYYITYFSEESEYILMGSGTYKTPIEAAYSIIVWLLENNYIEKSYESTK
jgi:hypothetical protein